MNKAEKYIQDYTKNCCNIEYTQGYYPPSYQPWLTPDQARKAVEIAREEIYEWLKDNIHMYNGQCENDRIAIIEDLKQVMKDE